MLRKKNGQVHQGIPKIAAAAEKNLFQRLVRRKGITVVVSLLLLVEVIILGTVAWYTRISNVTGMTMDVAEFDFNANYVEEDFIVSVDQYLNVASGKAAPGTGGIIPIRLGADNSEVAANYSINLDFSETADEFRDRIRFFYYTLEDGRYILHNIDPATSLNVGSALKGVVNTGENVYEYICWEWVYDLSGDGWFASDGRWYNGATSEGQAKFAELYPTPEDLTAAQDAFDAFDTLIGMQQANDTMDCSYSGVNTTISADEGADGSAGKLYAYQKAMIVKLNITGASARPQHTEDMEGGEYPSGGTSVYYAGPESTPTPEPTAENPAE